LESIAKHYFARDEVAGLATLSPENRNAAFFRCWSRKEAFVKALGAGLSLPLDSFCVSIDEEPDAAIQGQPLGSSAAEWRLFDVTPRAGYSAALVTEGQPGAIYCALAEDPAKLVDEWGEMDAANSPGMLS
jgi:4'-phosphopantetheinyl transferase